jgi:purine catabolism regulator
MFLMDQTPAPRVTVADLLRLVLPLNTEVQGGADTRSVANWVAVLTELSQLQNQVHPGDVVIMPVALQQQATEPLLVKTVQLIAEFPAAALLAFRAVPEAAVRAAEELGMPILIIPDTVTFREVHQGVAGLLMDRQNQTTERGMQLYRRLTELSREGQGLAAMTETMSRLTGKIVAVQDKRLEIKALITPPNSVLDDATVRAALRQQEKLPTLLRNRKAAATAPQSYWQQLLSIGDIKMARLVSPIVSGDRARGYVSVVGAPDELDMLDKLTAEHGAAACALEMAKAKAVSEAKKSLRGDFLEGLLAGRLPEREVERLAGRLDHDTTCRHAIMTFAWDGERTPTLRRLETPLNWLLSSHNRPALTHVYGAEHVCVFQALRPRDEDMSSALELARRLREHLRAEFPKVALRAGISGPASGIDEWPIVYRQSVQALDLARRLKLDSIIDFNDMGIYQLLTQLEDVPVLRRFCRDVMGPLVDYDAQHRSSLVQTIGSYFAHHGNISQTAEALYIHRNTLLYRLDRIQELTGQNLDEADMRLALHLALKLLELQPEGD